MAHTFTFKGVPVYVDTELWKDSKVKINTGRHGIWTTRKACFMHFLEASASGERASEYYSSITFDYDKTLTTGDNCKTIYEEATNFKVQTTDATGETEEKPIHLLVRPTVIKYTPPDKKPLLNRIFGKSQNIPKPALLFECNTLPFIGNTLKHMDWADENIKKYIEE